MHVEGFCRARYPGSHSVPFLGPCLAPYGTDGWVVVLDASADEGESIANGPAKKNSGPSSLDISSETSNVANSAMRAVIRPMSTGLCCPMRSFEDFDQSG